MPCTVHVLFYGASSLLQPIPFVQCLLPGSGPRIKRWSSLCKNSSMWWLIFRWLFWFVFAETRTLQATTLLWHLSITPKRASDMFFLPIWLPILLPWHCCQRTHHSEVEARQGIDEGNADVCLAIAHIRTCRHGKRNAWSDYPEKLMVNKVEAQVAQGIYGACYKIAILMTVFIQAFRTAEPFFFNRAKEKDSKTYAVVMKYFIIFLSSFFWQHTEPGWIKYFVGSAYWGRPHSLCPPYYWQSFSGRNVQSFNMV